MGGGASELVWVSCSLLIRLAGPAVEAALCRAVLAPLRPALWTRLRKLRAPELRRLRRQQTALRAEAGPEGQGPVPALRRRIHARLQHLHAACAPRRKVALLLAMCRDIYEGLASGKKPGKEGGGCVSLDVDRPEGCRSHLGGACVHVRGEVACSMGGVCAGQEIR